MDQPGRPGPNGRTGRRGLDRLEAACFVFGVLAFAFLMLAFAGPLEPALYLPVVGLWVVGGLAFVWWLHHRLT